jgi:hypothetical protein
VGGSVMATETTSPKVPLWDHKLYDRSVLSDYDQRCLPYAISQYLHNVTGIPHCNGGNTICAMCGGAVRLVLQAAEPKIKRAIVEKMQRDLGVSCPFPHRGDD